ncbi:MAG: hypothetical protein JOZ99_05420 [Actinobacteria bacterium]|nr:hypothetical protein [Actinomycetota bacterium]
MTTTRFVELTRRVASSLRMPDCRIVVVEHPLGGTDDPGIVARADAAVETIIASLCRA